MKQKGDVVIQGILSNVREGIFDDALVRFLTSRIVHKSQLPHRSIRLYASRREAREDSDRVIQELPGRERC